MWCVAGRSRIGLLAALLVQVSLLATKTSAYSYRFRRAVVPQAWRGAGPCSPPPPPPTPTNFWNVQKSQQFPTASSWNVASGLQDPTSRFAYFQQSFPWNAGLRNIPYTSVYTLGWSPVYYPYAHHHQSGTYGYNLWQDWRFLDPEELPKCSSLVQSTSQKSKISSHKHSATEASEVGSKCEESSLDQVDPLVQQSAKKGTPPTAAHNVTSHNPTSPEQNDLIPKEDSPSRISLASTGVSPCSPKEPTLSPSWLWDPRIPAPRPLGNVVLSNGVRVSVRYFHLILQHYVRKGWKDVNFVNGAHLQSQTFTQFEATVRKFSHVDTMFFLTPHLFISAQMYCDVVRSLADPKVVLVLPGGCRCPLKDLQLLPDYATWQRLLFPSDLSSDPLATFLLPVISGNPMRDTQPPVVGLPKSKKVVNASPAVRKSACKTPEKAVLSETKAYKKGVVKTMTV